VAAYVKQIKGAIGYVELSYALQNKIAYSRLKNAAGNYVNPGNETFQAAAASADWKNAKDFDLVMTNARGDNAWPIAATNFILMYRQPKNAAGAKAAREFFRWAYANGDAQATALGYVPLPDSLVQQIEAYWSRNMKY
jgi:phosphate transport system substrate-binding protein